MLALLVGQEGHEDTIVPPILKRQAERGLRHWIGYAPPIGAISASEDQSHCQPAGVSRRADELTLRSLFRVSVVA